LDLDALLHRLSGLGLRHGLSGDGWQWLALGASAYLWRRLRRQHDGPLAILRVKEGDRYVIELVDRRVTRGSRQDRRRDLVARPAGTGAAQEAG
jgi:hypothetical protein